MTDSNGPEKGVKTPRNLSASGRRLWDAATAEFEWADHELAILEEACRTRDRVVQLDKAVDDDGLMLTSSQGSRVHPAVSEGRQQRLALARLLVLLRIPALEEEGATTRNTPGTQGRDRR